MAGITTVIFYIFVFLSVYVQVFFFVTFLENRKKIVIRKGKIKLAHYPAVTITVPVFNEEKTVEQTVFSLLNLNYPKDKLKLFLIDDGSTDGTWDVLNKFTNNPHIKIFRKENGGKYTALNLALENTETEFFGGLDADSYADPESLMRIMSYFEKNPNVMAVAPSVIVHNPKNMIQNAQKAEYHMGVYLKKMLDFLGAINVTPGPLTIFRKKVFTDLGLYRHGHNTEDMEIAYRMQKNRYQIEHCNDAYVYTSTPTTIKKLYKQRLRWIYGFLNNTLDYRKVLFRKKYGNFSLFTLPVGVISIISAMYLFSKVIYSFGHFLYFKFIVLNTIGWHFSPLFSHFDWFFINIKSFSFLVILVYFLVIFAMIFGRRMTEGKWGLSFGMVYFFPVFSVIAPFWLLSAVYNTILSRRPAWR
ncbi:MAG: glycosyltransferase family 2 protein [Candidatus Parcubacteria bacterium]|nr:glycosyltransferase family 2 protein [Candidatus Parcubacteria bacterium]